MSFAQSSSKFASEFLGQFRMVTSRVIKTLLCQNMVVAILAAPQ